MAVVRMDIPANKWMYSQWFPDLLSDKVGQIDCTVAAASCLHSKQMQCSFPAVISDVCSTIKPLKEVGIVIHITSLLKLSPCFVQKTAPGEGQRHIINLIRR